jgi:hypothetical protein
MTKKVLDPEFASLLWHHEQDGNLAQVIVRHAKHGAVADALELARNLLNLSWRDVLATADD